MHAFRVLSFLIITAAINSVLTGSLFGNKSGGLDWSKHLTKCAALRSQKGTFYCASHCADGDSPTIESTRRCSNNKMCCMKRNGGTTTSPSITPFFQDCAALKSPSGYFYCARMCGSSDIPTLQICNPGKMCCFKQYPTNPVWTPSAIPITAMPTTPTTVMNNIKDCHALRSSSGVFYCASQCRPSDSETLESNQRCSFGKVCCFMRYATSQPMTTTAGRFVNGIPCSMLTQPTRFYYCSSRCHNGDTQFMGAKTTCGISSDRCCVKTTGVAFTSLMQSNHQFYCAKFCATGHKEYSGAIKAKCIDDGNKCCVMESVLPEFCTKIQRQGRIFYCASRCFHGDSTYNMTTGAMCGSPGSICCSRKAKPKCTSITKSGLNFYCAKKCLAGDKNYTEDGGAKCGLDSNVCCVHNLTTTDLCTSNSIQQPNKVFYCFERCIAGDTQYTGPGGTRCGNEQHRCCVRNITEQTTPSQNTCTALQDGQVRYCAATCLANDVQDTRTPSPTCNTANFQCCIRVSLCTDLVPTPDARLYYCAQTCLAGHTRFPPTVFPQPTCATQNQICCQVP